MPYSDEIYRHITMLQNTITRLDKEIRYPEVNSRNLRIECDTLSDQIGNLEIALNKEVDPILARILAILPNAIMDTDDTGEIVISTGLYDEEKS